MSGPASYSLRRRLVWLLTSAVAAIWLLSALVVYQRAHHEADALLDTQLTQVADTLLVIVAGGEVEHFVEELHEHARRTPVPIAFEVWHRQHGQTQRLVTSTGHAGFETGVAPGFSEHLHQGARWRFYALQDDDAEYRVVVGQAHAARESLARRDRPVAAAARRAGAAADGAGRVVGRQPLAAAGRAAGAPGRLRSTPQALAPLDESARCCQTRSPRCARHSMR